LGQASVELFFRYDTEVVGGKFCGPSPKALANPLIAGQVQAFKGLFDNIIGGDDNPAMSYLADIIAVKDLLLISLGTGFLIGFVYMIFLRLCGGPIIYITILLTIVSSGAGSFMLYDMSQQMCGLKGDFK